jgi:copper oxidase (laccase) domain-containing protein
MNILDYVRIETSTKDDGNMAYDKGKRDKVFHNRKVFFRNSNMNYDNTYEIISNHNVFNKVKIVRGTPKQIALVKDVDALITNNKDIVLALCTADCLQITAFDKENEVLALIHSGFRWQDAGIIDKTFEIMKEKFNTRMEDVLIHLGNCVSEDKYRWDENILNVTHEESWIRKTITKDDDPEHPYVINLRKAAILNLKDIGLKDENILDTGIDCYTNNQYFSHVRSVYTDDKDGRHVTLVQMK